MPIAPSNNPPSITTTNSGSLSSALGVGRSLSAGRGGDGGDGLQQRNINLSPSGSLDTSFSIGNDQAASRRANPSHAGLLEEGLTLSPSTVVGGFTGAYNSLTGTPALFNFDWEATFDPLASTGNLYEQPPSELVNEALTSRQDLGVSLPVPPNSTTSNNTTPTLDTAHPSIVGGTSTKQASPLARTSAKRKADTDPAPATQSWAVPAAREESRKRSQVGPGQSINTSQTPRKWAHRPSPTPVVGGSGSTTEAQTGNGVSHTRSNSLAVNNPTSANTPGRSGGPASNTPIRRTASEGDEANSGRTPSIMRATRAQSFPEIPKILPHEKVFPVQIGCELFRLSGASISSDGQCSPVFCSGSLRGIGFVDKKLRMLEHPHILPSFSSVK
jgi:hypothetical protein